MSFHFADIARHASADGAVSPAELLELRRAGWADGRMNREEAAALFTMQRCLAAPTAEWSDFFVEALQNFILNGTPPHGYATDADAAWLIEQIDTDGRVSSLDELELVVRIIERALNVPEALKLWVLGTLEREVLYGTGPTRDGGELSARAVTGAECRLIRRVIFGSGGDGPAAVSRAEAEMLFRIKDASLEANNAPEFRQLFVQGVGHYLQGLAARGGQLSRERTAQLDAFMNDHSSSIGRFMGRMALGVPSGFGQVFGRKPAPAAERMAQLDAAEQVTAQEQGWLDVQLNANGKIDSYDRALLEFLAEAD